MGNIKQNEAVSLKIYNRTDISFEDYAKTSDFEKQNFYAVPITDGIKGPDGTTTISKYRFYIGDNELTYPIDYADSASLSSGAGDNRLVKGSLLKSYVADQIGTAIEVIEEKANETIFEVGKFYYSTNGSNTVLKFCHSTLGDDKFITLSEAAEVKLYSDLNNENEDGAPTQKVVKIALENKVSTDNDSMIEAGKKLVFGDNKLSLSSTGATLPGASLNDDLNMNSYKITNVGEAQITTLKLNTTNGTFTSNYFDFGSYKPSSASSETDGIFAKKAIYLTGSSDTQGYYLNNSGAAQLNSLTLLSTDAGSSYGGALKVSGGAQLGDSLYIAKNGATINGNVSITSGDLSVVNYFSTEKTEDNSYRILFSTTNHFIEANTGNATLNIISASSLTTSGAISTSSTISATGNISSNAAISAVGNVSSDDTISAKNKFSSIELDILTNKEGENPQNNTVAIKANNEIVSNIDITLPSSSGTLALTTELSTAQSTLEGQISGLDTKLSGEIDDLEEDLSGQISELNTTLSGQISSTSSSLSGQIGSVSTALSQAIVIGAGTGDDSMTPPDSVSSSATKIWINTSIGNGIICIYDSANSKWIPVSAMWT